MLKTYDIRTCTCVDAIQVTMMYYSGDEHTKIEKMRTSAQKGTMRFMTFILASSAACIGVNCSADVLQVIVH